MTRRTQNDDNELMRLLHSELPPVEAGTLRERLLREPELAAAYERLERTWSGLDLPPAAPPPAGFAGRVMANARSRQAARISGDLSWTSAPRWVRATAGAALIAGAALGAGVGQIWSAEAVPDSTAPAASSLSSPEFNLAEGYWDVVEDATAPAPEIQR